MARNEHLRKNGNQLAPVLELLDLDVTADSLLHSRVGRDVTEEVDHAVAKLSAKNLGVDLTAHLALRAGADAHTSSLDLGLGVGVNMRLDVNQDIQDKSEISGEVIHVGQLLGNRLRLLALWNGVDRHGERNVLPWGYVCGLDKWHKWRGRNEEAECVVQLQMLDVL